MENSQNVGLTQLRSDDDDSSNKNQDVGDANPISNLGVTPLHHAAEMTLTLI